MRDVCEPSAQIGVRIAGFRRCTVDDVGARRLEAVPRNARRRPSAVGGADPASIRCNRNRTFQHRGLVRRGEGRGRGGRPTGHFDVQFLCECGRIHRGNVGIEKTNEKITIGRRQ